MTRQRTFSEQIRKLLKESDVTRYRISQDTGIDQAVLSRFVNKKGGLSMDALDQLAEYFGWSVIADDKKRRQKGKK